jgi:hypothetical protein
LFSATFSSKRVGVIASIAFPVDKNYHKKN